MLKYLYNNSQPISIKKAIKRKSLICLFRLISIKITKNNTRLKPEIASKFINTKLRNYFTKITKYNFSLSCPINQNYFSTIIFLPLCTRYFAPERDMFSSLATSFNSSPLISAKCTAFLYFSGNSDTTNPAYSENSCV